MKNLEYRELSEYLDKIEDVIKFSIKHNLNVHSYLGGKYGELWVIKELWQHEPKIADERGDVDVKNANSCDVVLAKTRKKIEVKWGRYHENNKVTKQTKGISCWGWGFSQGTQFLKKKFDYCILLAAESMSAKPKHIFVLPGTEMTNESMGGKRNSYVSNKGSYFIEYSENRDYYYARRWHQGASRVEELLWDGSMHQARWEELVNNGEL